jgi:hypothetical protein
MLAARSIRVAGVSAALVLLAVSAASAAGPRGKADALHSQASVLDTRAHHALLDLYALDTRYERAQSQLAALQARAARLRTEQLQLAQQISVTRQTLVVSQRRLGDHL